jgi:tRNA (guanine37-N1)-methyltransferase
MNSRALRIPRVLGEVTRRRLQDRGLLRADLRIRADGDDLLFPIEADATDLGELRMEETADFLPTNPPAARSYADLLPEELRASGMGPRSFDVVGDIVVVRIPPDFPHDPARVGEALLQFVPGARLVGADRGVHGSGRIRLLDRIAGSGPWSTIHTEHGLRIWVDLERAYFSPRLAEEHHRVASEVRAGETVFDLCCGVGPFTAHIARDGRATRITAVDSNPDAISLLHQTLGALRPTVRVDARVESVEDFLSRSGVADRAILNLPHEGIKYLHPLMERVARGGTLHYYEITPRRRVQERGSELVSGRAAIEGWQFFSARRVHAYSPQSDLVGYTLRRLE